VKTRLAATIGDDAAAELHRLFLTTLLNRFQAVADRQLLYYSPPDAGEAFSGLSASWERHAQSDGDLGARMHDFFERGFEAGADKIVLIGADSPSLPAELVQQAFRSLDDRSVVIGPSEDGGYYLVGARRNTPPIFGGVNWGSEDVFCQTAAMLDAARIEFTVLSTWFDVDRAADLNRLQAEIADVDDVHLAKLSVSISDLFKTSADTRTD